MKSFRRGWELLADMVGLLGIWNWIGWNWVMCVAVWDRLHVNDWRTTMGTAGLYFCMWM